MPRQVHLATRVDAKSLLVSPDVILQQMSLKIFQRRQELIEDLIGKRVEYELNDNATRSGIVERMDDSHSVVIRDGVNKVKVSIRRLRLP